MKGYYLLLLVLLQAVCSVSAQQQNQYVSYSEYGAVGDGVTDDFDAIIKAHEAANEAGRNVRADAGATYYIGAADKTALIQTDTDWGDAQFIIDDTKVERRNNHVFNVTSHFPSVQLTNIASLKKNQSKIDLSLTNPSVIVAIDSKSIRYIRWGPDQNNGMAQTDVFVVDKNGNVDKNTPIIWDFDQFSSMTAYPIDDKVLTVKGGRFTTIANQFEPPYRYFARGIGVTRSNVVIDGVYHTITGELEHSAPYNGFIAVSNCTDVLVQNCLLTGRRYYSIGTYELTVNRANNVTFKDCKQMNTIHERTHWGTFASNYSKNITFDGVTFSRFDAHMGVVNATIKNSVLGHQGVNIIGSGLFLLENTKVCGGNFINLRSDYGSTWEGDIIIRNCEYLPRNGLPADATLINGYYTSQHDFGYTCYMPAKITIDGLVINDSNPVEGYQGPKLFADFNKEFTSDRFKEDYPYRITNEVEIKNLTIKSGKPLIVSNNSYMFRNVKITGTPVVTAGNVDTKKTTQKLCVLKLDDVMAGNGGQIVPERWQRVADYLEGKKVKSSMGIIGVSLENHNPAYYKWITDRAARGYIEFWNHGYHNRSDDDLLGEFEGEYDEQLRALQLTDSLARTKLGLNLCVWGPHWSGANENTDKALAQMPQIRMTFGYPSKTVHYKGYVFPRSIDIEYPTHNPDFEQFKKAYQERESKLEFFFLQGHPNSWDETRWANFTKVIDFLLAENVRFVTPSELYDILGLK